LPAKKLQPLALHLAATEALNAPNVESEVDARIAAEQIANLMRPAVVSAPVRSTATAVLQQLRQGSQ